MIFDYKAFFSDLYDNIVLHWQYCIILAALVVLFVAIKRVRKALSPIKVSKSNYGSLSISRRALIRTVVHVAVDLGLRSEPKVNISSARGKLYLELYIRLSQDQVFEKFSIALQESVSNALVNELGVAKDLEISVILSGVDKCDTGKES